MDSSQLKDAGSERAVISTIVKYGKDTFIDADAVLSATDFGLPINRKVYTCLKALSDDPNCEIFDTDSIKLKAKNIGIEFDGQKDLEYIELLNAANFDPKNVQMFAMQVKKFAIARHLNECYSKASNYIQNISGQESIAEIVNKAESLIVDYVSGVDTTNALDRIGSDIENKVQHLLESEPVDQIGLPTGFNLYDEAIGGGPRPGTVSIIGARAKRGKSFVSLNIANNVAHRGIPVLYLDTELTKDYQQNRLMAMNANCPLHSFETGHFRDTPELVNNVKEAVQVVKNLPFHYQSIAGVSHSEAMAIARRWLVKHVGFNANGTAKPCLIIYDYVKLTSSEGLSGHTPEYILLGLILTELHNFAVKYNVPIFGLVQLNRDGITAEDTSVVAGSDRILWLCSSLTLLKDKDNTDKDLGCGFEHGNKKLVILETRQGSGLEIEGDYINLHASIRPGINKEFATGIIREGFKFSNLVQSR